MLIVLAKYYIGYTLLMSMKFELNLTMSSVPTVVCIHILITYI